MIHRVALCIDTLDFLENRIFDEGWAKKFPGALAYALFADHLISRGYEIATGDIAVRNVQTGDWNSKDIIIIQDLNSVYGRWLLEQGAEPRVLIGYESPGYAPDFYDQLDSIAPKFQHRILFAGAFEFFNTWVGNDHHACFPSFDMQEILPVRSWKEREFLVMVAGNKSYLESFSLPFYRNPLNYFRWIRHVLAKKVSRTRRLASKTELQTQRLSAIEHFGAMQAISLFGENWNDLSRLTLNWQKRLAPILGHLKPEPCQDKLQTIAKYKFSICFENMCFPGYVTEKIIDCFVAGTIPIYLGAPDISDLIPPDTFVDPRNFDSWISLHRYLEEMSEDDALEIIRRGRDFLDSAQGKKYSYISCAELWYRLITEADLVV